ncbi:hypothetical protein SAMN02745127_02603 [Oceanospirillum multiglobuliferum]|uniref:Lipoprotein n=1 Tax=Oceanospirillum multiglobuliferum TaxID=64969 RepID=A0A1T4RVZ7_9GAMM|nr:hypothetical protein [Oceanospirillum multiglobuliferum]OPX54564.1 hypothetical protein BTE48_13350 [Oceanospirillum multiglobuliferum]SKA20179.1 hypothetical protein SAMN02745127_02603 [Oceanospirillum multiglobuliferum]
MKTSHYLLATSLAVTLLAGCASDDVQEQPMEQMSEQNVMGGAGPMTLAHINHVRSRWADTPNQVGLLTIAREEAAIARTHAHLAAKKADNTDWVKMHAVHIKHALIPNGEKGPGKGYGLIKAVAGVQKHTMLALEQDDKSQAVALYGEQIVASTDSINMRLEQMYNLVAEILRAPRSENLSSQAHMLAKLSDQVLMGEDLNQDGEIDWRNNEPGLNQTLRYLNDLSQKEAL